MRSKPNTHCDAVILGSLTGYGRADAPSNRAPLTAAADSQVRVWPGTEVPGHDPERDTRPRRATDQPTPDSPPGQSAAIRPCTATGAAHMDHPGRLVYLPTSPDQSVRRSGAAWNQVMS
jgi:hypothetical protein